MFIAQTHQPGAEAEVDFGEVAVNLRGQVMTCTLFSCRMSFSGKAVHRLVDRTNGVSYQGLLV